MKYQPCPSCQELFTPSFWTPRRLAPLFVQWSVKCADFSGTEFLVKAEEAEPVQNLQGPVQRGLQTGLNLHEKFTFPAEKLIQNLLFRISKNLSGIF